MKKPLIPESVSYTFADYFKLNADVEDVVAHFGYGFQLKKGALPRRELDTAHMLETKARLEESLAYVSLTSEVARREFLIAPVLIEAAHYSHARVKVEFPLEVNDQLKGTLDYLLRAKNNFLVVEAKNADLQRGFTQLAVELIALDQWEEDIQELLCGAVSVGDVWRFATLDRGARRVTQDLDIYRVPADLEEVLMILVAVLTG